MHVRCLTGSTAPWKQTSPTVTKKTIDRCLLRGCYELTLAASARTLVHVLIKHIGLDASNWEDKGLAFQKWVGQWFPLFLSLLLG